MGRITIEVDGFECERCGHTWIARWPRGVPESKRKGKPPPPKMCPVCKSRLWDVPHKGNKQA
jgi:hypothetical protein